MSAKKPLRQMNALVNLSVVLAGANRHAPLTRRRMQRLWMLTEAGGSGLAQLGGIRHCASVPFSS